MIKPTEAEFQEQVTQLAETLGWQWVHFKRARYKNRWLTATSGTLGKGWVDLLLVRPRDNRMIFVELKRDGQKPEPVQFAVLGILAGASSPPFSDVYWWTPSDWPIIEAVLL